MASTLVNVQQYMSLYGLSVFYVFGTIGNLFLIRICLQPTHRRNPASFYLLSASIVNFIVIQLMLPLGIYAGNHPDPLNYIAAWCKIRGYLVNVCFMIYRWCKIAACIDRAAMCNQRAWIRSFSDIRIAHRVVIILIIVWAIIPSHIIVFNVIYNNRCVPQPGLYSKLFSIYAVVVAGWSPPILMAIFGAIGYISLKQIRARVTPTNAPNRVNDVSRNDQAQRQRITKLDQQLLISLTCEVVLYILTNLLYSANVTYSAITASDSKTTDRIRIETFISYFSSPFLIIMNNCAGFYLYLIVSSKFRQDLKQLCTSYCRIRETISEYNDQPTAINRNPTTNRSIAISKFHQSFN